jgi:hypothetical protein
MVKLRKPSKLITGHHEHHELTPDHHFTAAGATCEYGHKMESSRSCNSPLQQSESLDLSCKSSGSCTSNSITFSPVREWDAIENYKSLHEHSQKENVIVYDHD